MGFISPESIVKASPSIKNLMRDPVSEKIENVENNEKIEKSEKLMPTLESMSPPVQPQVPTPAAQPQTAVNQQTTTPQPQVPAAQPQPTANESATPAPLPSNPDQYFDAFMACWSQLIDTIFVDVPTLHAPLKNYTPTIKENIVHVPLKNERQMDDFAIKKTAILQYLRTHFDEKIDDVLTEIEEHGETKKFILDEHDKMQALKEQNPDVLDFMSALNLRLRN